MEDTTGAGEPAFPTTHASLIELVRHPEAPEFRAAWEAFFRAYWRPLYLWLRRTGSAPEEASDLLQDLFVEGLEEELLRGYDRERGRFRNYLTGCLGHRRLDLRRREAARPDRQRLPFLETRGVEASLADASAHDPQQALDEEWGWQVLSLAIDAMKDALSRKGDALSLRLLQEWVLETQRPPAATLSEALGISAGDLYTRATRLRQGLIEELRAQVRLWSPGAAAEGGEVEEVLRCLAR